MKFWQNKNFLSIQILGSLLALSFVVSILLYFKTLFIGFLSDDWHALYIAAHQKNVWSFFVTNILGTRVGNSYAPLWNVIVSAQYYTFGMQAFWHHLVNLIVFSMTGLLVMMLSYIPTNKKALSVLIGLGFLILGNHVEAVAWITGQIHLFTTLFYVFSLVCYALYLVKQKIYWYWLALLGMILALLVKESALTLPGAWLVLEWLYAEVWWQKNTIIKILKRFIAPALVVGLYLLLRVYTTGIAAGYYGNAELELNFFTQARMALEMTVNMVFSYPYRGIILNKIITYPYIFALLILLFGYYLYSIKYYKKQLYAVLVIYLISLLPYLFLGYSPQGNEGERLAYLPSVWFVIALGFLFYDVFKRTDNQYIRSVICILIVFFGVSQVWRLHNQVKNWESAGQVVQKGFESLEKFNFNENEVVYLVGVPDTIRGAQMFRNGTLLAMELKGKKWEGDRVYMMSALLPGYTNESFVAIKRTTSTIKFSVHDPKFYFVGFPNIQTTQAEFRLTSFIHPTQSGTEIEVIPRLPGAGESNMRKKIIILYYNQGSFQRLEL